MSCCGFSAGTVGTTKQSKSSWLPRYLRISANSSSTLLAPNHPRELAEHDCLLFWPAGKIWAFESAAGLVSVAPRPRLSANDMVVLTAAAVHGNGIALLPTYAVAKAMQSGMLIEVMKTFSDPQVWIKALVSERRASIPRVRSLLTFMKARLSPVPPWDRGLIT